MVGKRSKKTTVRMPDWFTGYVWQPLKALLVAGQAWILWAMLKKTVPGLWTVMAWPAYLLESAGQGVILAGTVIVTLIFWRHYDAIDDVSFLLFVHEPEPRPLICRATWLLSVGLSGILCGCLFAQSVRPLLALTSLPKPAAAILPGVIGIAAAAGLRLWMVVSLGRTWREQRAIYDEATTYTSVKGQILYSVLLFVGLWMFIRLLIRTGILVGMAINAFGLIKLLFTEGWKLLLIIAGILLAIRFVLFLIQMRERRQYVRHIRALDNRQVITAKVYGHPYLSLLFPRMMFGFHITDAAGQAYNVGVANTGWKRGNVFACDHFTLQFMFQLRLRIAPKTTAVGVVNPGSTEMGEWYTTHPVRKPPEDGLASTGKRPQPVETVMLIDPAPRALWERTGCTRAALDNGSRVCGYTVYTKNAFTRMLERKNSRTRDE